MTEKRLSGQKGTVFLAAILLSVVSLCAAIAQQPDQPQVRAETSPLRFLRVFVPADRVSDWPRQNVPYVPMEGEEFEQLVSLVKRLSNLARHPSALLEDASYEMQLENGKILTGRATIRIHHRDIQLRTVSLEPCNLAVSNAVWLDADSQPAELGLAPSGQLKLQLETAEILQFDFKRRAEDPQAEILRFRLELPAAQSSRLQVWLPEGLLLESSAGTVIPPNEKQQSVANTRSANEQLWQVELGGNNRTELVVRPKTEQARLALWPRYRQANIYRLSGEGLEVVTRFAVSQPEAADKLFLYLVGNAQPVAISVDNQLVDLEQLPRAQDGDRLRISLPDELTDLKQFTLEVRAVASLTAGQPVVLPRIGLENALWLAEVSTIQVDKWQELQSLHLSEARQVVPLVESSQGAVYQIQHFSPNTQIKLQVRPKQPRVTLRSATVVQAGTDRLLARLYAVVSAAEIPAFSLEAELAPHWQIITVETVPTDMLADWTVLANPLAERHTLRIELNQPISHEQTLQLRIVAQARGLSPGSVFQADHLVPVVFTGQDRQHQWLHIEPEGPVVLQAMGPTVAFRESGPPPEIASLLPTVRPGMDVPVWQASQLTLRLEPARQHCSANLQTWVNFALPEPVQVIRVFCQPNEGYELDQIDLRFSHQPQSHFRWFLTVPNKTGTEPPQTEDLLNNLLQGKESLLEKLVQVTPTVQAQQEESNSTTQPNPAYLVSLKLPVLVPTEGIELIGFCRLPKQSELSVPLPQVIDARPQEGLVGIIGVNWSDITYAEAVLRPASPLDADPFPAVASRALCFRYRWPTSVLRPQVLTIKPKDKAKLPPALIPLLRYTTEHGLKGTVKHHIVFGIEGTLPDKLRLRLADRQIKLLRVAVNGTETTVKSDTDWLWIDLPARLKSPIVELEYTSLDKKILFAGQFCPALPQFELPVLQVEWTAWVPPAYMLRFSAPGLQRRLSWRKRLFGPLAQESTLELFDPLEWVEQTWGTNPPVAKVDPDAVVEKLLLQLGQQLLSSQDLTWAQAIARAASVLRRSFQVVIPDERPTVLVDQYGLSTIGIKPNTPLPKAQAFTTGPTRAKTPQEAAVEILKGAGLALLVCDHIVVMTDRITAAKYGQHEHALLSRGNAASVFWSTSDDVARAAHQVLFRVASPAVEKRLKLAAKGIDGRFTHPTGWSATSAGQFIDGNLASVDHVGWHAATCRFWPQTNVRLHIISQGYLWLAAAIAALAAAGIGTIILRGYRRSVVVLAAAALIALWTPELYSPIATATLLGLLLACLLRTLSPLRKPQTPDRKTESEEPPPDVPVDRALKESAEPDDGVAAESEQQTDQASQPPQPRDKERPSPGGRILLAVLLAVSLSKTSSAIGWQVTRNTAGESAAASTEKGPTYHVLIPIGEDKQPSGDKYQVPEGLYKQLVLQVEQLQDPWLVESAQYVLQLTSDESTRITLGELWAYYRVNVKRVPTQIKLAVGCPVDPTKSAYLDGRAVSLQTTESNSSIVLAVDRLGIHDLRIPLLPPVEETSGWSSVRFAIPPVPDAQLVVSRPLENLPVELLEPASGLPTSENDRTTSYLLGPARELHLRWRSQLQAQIAPTIERLSWLFVRDGAVWLETKLVATSGTKEPLLLQVPDTLRLVSSRPRANIKQQSDGHLLVELPPLSPQTSSREQQVYWLRFLLVGESGVGRIVLPQLDIDNVKLSSHLLALTAEDNIQWQLESDEDTEAVSTTLFARHWQSEQLPQAAWDITAGKMCVFSLRPAAAQVKAASQLVLVYSAESATVEYEAQLQVDAGYVYRLELAVPQQFSVNKLSVEAQARERGARWSVPRPGQLVVFLERPLAGQAQLRISGTIPLVAGLAPLPALKLQNVTDAETTVFLYRTPGVQISVKPDLTPSESSPLPPVAIAPAQARLVATLKLTDQQQNMQVELRPNRPKATARQVTRVAWADNALAVAVTFDIQVERGLLDYLLVEVPAWFTGPWQTDRPAEIKTIAAGPNYSLVALWPAVALEGSYRITLEGKVIPQKTNRIQVPLLSLRDVKVAEHLLLLPRTINDQPARWLLRNLEEIELPEQIPQQTPADENCMCCLVRSLRSTAALVLGGLPPELLMSEAEATSTDGHNWEIKLRCLLLPNNARQLRFWLGGDYRLLQIAINGKDSRLMTSGDGYAVALPDTELPIWVEIRYTARRHFDQFGELRLALPQFEQVEFERVLWHLYCPIGLKLVARTNNWGQSISSNELYHEQGRALVRAAQIAEQADVRPPDWWSADWYGRYLVLKRRLRALVAVSGTGVISDAAEWQEVNREEIQQLITALDTAAARLVETTPQTPNSGTDELSVLATDPTFAARYYLADQSRADAIVIGRDNTEQIPISDVLLCTLVIATVALVGQWPPVQKLLAGLVYHVPFLLVMLVGVGWWLALRPSLFGLVLSLCCVLAALRSAFWPRLRSDAAVIRVSDES